MKRNLFTKIGSLVMTGALTVGMFSVAGFHALRTKADETGVENFKADFSGLKSGVVSADDSETVKYLDDRFLFYSFQYYPVSGGDGDPQYFERKNVSSYLIDDGDNGQIFPDTGAHASYDMDGYGSNADKPIPKWTVDGKWLYSTSYSSADAPLFRTAEMMYLKGDTLTEFAILEDFKLETDFMFKEDGKQDNLAIYFRANSAGNAADGSGQSMIAFNTNGDLYVGRTPWHNVFGYNEKLNADGNNVTFKRGHEYHLSMVLKGSALTFTVTDGSNTVATYTRNDIQASEGKQGGYLALSGSNGGVKYANISAERYGRDGSILDFNDLTEGYGFGINIRAYNCYRTKYVCKEGGTRFGDSFNRDPGAAYEFDYNARHGEGDQLYWIGKNSVKQVAAELDSRFNVYHDQNVGGVEKFAKAPNFYSYTNATGIEAGYPGAMYLANGNRLLTRFDSWGQDLLKQNISLVPKTNDGNEVVAENFETRFSALLFNNGTKQTVSLSFRSKAAGRSINDDVTGGYAGKVTIHFNGAGYAIFDGESSPLSELSYTPWNEGRILDGAANIYVKAVGDKLWMQVTTDNGDVLYDNSSSPITLKTGGSGYIYYTSNDTWAYFTSIACDRLDKNGNAADWNDNDSVSMKDLSSQELIKVLGRADFVGDDLIMDQTNSGFEINGTLYGDVSIDTKRADNPEMADDIDGCYVNVIVDGGEPTRVKVPNGANTVKLVSGLSEGKHTLQVIAADSAYFGSLSVSRIKYTGKLEKPASDNSRLHILAVGDAITAGFGVNGKNGDSSGYAEQIETGDGYLSYAAVASRLLDSKLCVVAKEDASVGEMCNYVNKLSSNGTAPDWDWSDDKHDVVVINLGTNDEALGKAKETVLKDAKSLLDDMRAKNPDAEIIWVYGMMRKDYKDVYEAAVKYMNDKGDSKVHLLEMTKNEAGLKGYPNKAAHSEYGKKLADYIRNLVGEPYAEHTDTIKALDDAGMLTIVGRNKWNETSLASTHGAAGFIFKGDIADDIVLNFKQSENLIRLAVIVDGNTATMKTLELKPNENSITLATGLERGVHTVAVRRATSDTGITELQSIKYNGTLMKPEEKKLQMEFLGDSITVGDGMLWNGDNHDYINEQNTMLGYASQTAAKLNAEFSMVAHSGIKTDGMISSYAEANRDFTLNSNGKQIVVINLGTNDIGLPPTCDTAALRKSIGELMDAVVEQNGKHVCIVWAYGMMRTKGVDVIKEAVESQANGRNIWFCDLSAALDNGGCAEHPTKVGNDKAAEILAKFITDNCLPVVEAGHNLTKTEAKAATCTEDGNTEYYTCSVCGKIFKDADGTQETELKDTVVPAGHKLTKVEAKAATCENDGNIEYYICSGCDKLFKDANATQKIEQKDTVIRGGHKLTKTNAKAATCENDGNIEYYTCSVCGKLFADANATQEIEQKDVTISMSGHKLTKVEAKAATTDSDGNIEHYTCSECGKLFADAEGEKELTADEVRIAKLAKPDTDQKDDDRKNDQNNTGSDSSNSNGSSDTSNVNHSPKTGDTRNPIVAAVALLVAMAAVLVAVVTKKRKKIN